MVKVKNKSLSDVTKIIKKDKYYLGLDLGISSVGWAVMVKDQAGDHYLHDFGVRIFYPAEDKDKKSDVQTRREFRSRRRLIHRRAYRIKKIKKILDGFLVEKQFKKDFNWKSTNKIIKKNRSYITEKGYWNPFVVRNKGLEEKLTKAEIYAILIHFCKKRGYLDKFSMDEKYVEQDKNNVGKTFAEFKRSKKTKFSLAIDKAEKLIKTDKYVSKVVLNEPEFWDKEQKLLHIKNGEGNYKYLFSRKAYENELKAILEKQSSYYEEIKKTKDELIETVFQHRDFEVGAKCKEHTKNKELNIKCNPSVCSKYKTFIESVRNCPFYPEKTRGYKSSLLFSAYYFVVEISKFLSFLKNWEGIGIRFEKFNLLILLKNFMTENWGKPEIKTYLKETKIWKEKGLDSLFKVDWWKNSKSGMDLNKAIFLRKITKISKLKKLISNINFNSNLSSQLEENILNKLGEILSNNITPQRRREKIEMFCESNNLDLNKEELEKLVYIDKFATSPAKVSFKHMIKTIKLFLEGNNISKDNYVTLEENKMKKWQKTKKRKNEQIFDRLMDKDMQNNPIVFRAVNQARKVLKALHQVYGNFEAINIELTRDVAKSSDDRNKIKKSQNKNAENNEKIGEKLEKMGEKMTRTNIVAYKLWIEQDEKCIYCGEKIIIDNIIPSKKIVEIDHIIPISKFADDSYLNKVLVCLRHNQNKRNRTPLQFLSESEKKGFKLRAERIRWKAKKVKKSQKKHFYLMTKNVEGNEDFDNFISRNLNDTGWIAKWFLGYVKNQLSLFNKKTKTLAVAGQITSQLRKNWLKDSAWGLQKKVRDITPFHHTVDAMILCQFKGQYEVELASNLYHLNKLKENWQREKNLHWKEQAEEDYNNFSKWIKNKWQKREKNDFVKLIGKLDGEDMLAKPTHIKDLRVQIKKRIPVILSIVDCEDCKGKKTSWNCKNCLGGREVPEFKELLNEKEWEEREKNNIQNADKINLRFQLVSYMTNYKTKSSWASSKNFGFGVLKKREAKSQKTLKEKIKKWNEYSKTLKNKNKSFVFDKKTGNIKPDCDGSSADPGFIFDKKTGNITLTNQYYGLLLENNKNKWIRQINIKKFLKNKNTLESIKNKLLVKGVNIRYWDQKKGKYLVKTFRAKNGPKSEIHPNQLQYISGKVSKGKKKILKSKEIFNGWINNEDTTNNIQKKDFKIIKIDILGNIVNN